MAEGFRRMTHGSPLATELHVIPAKAGIQAAPATRTVRALWPLDARLRGHDGNAVSQGKLP